MLDWPVCYIYEHYMFVCMPHGQLFWQKEGVYGGIKPWNSNQTTEQGRATYFIISGILASILMVFSWIFFQVIIMASIFMLYPDKW